MFNAVNRWLVEYTNLPPLSVPHIGPFEILDILIVAFVVYVILRWIRRTHAWILLRGIIAIVILALLAQIFNLYALMWLIRNAYAMGLVVIVILFQPELRKALEQIGRGKYLSSFKNEAEQKSHADVNTIYEIIKAAKILSAANTGALIVLEQDIDLRDYEREGIVLDAQVSAQLLLNIFEKNTPLHDGAVIVRENRVAAASCILPLTAEHVDAEIGTRHRAAIGMSEASDARVVVVSEETGTVSIAIAGEMTRDVNEAQMRDMLLWGKPNKQRFALFRKKVK
ncbi:MAG: diadenylate cyclase CdaA [Defluviitaleaceae bacterium]|nr:diadenylate cyclase CdaA [Defluviitaleaceae bacterium]